MGVSHAQTNIGTQIHIFFGRKDTAAFSKQHTLTIKTSDRGCMYTLTDKNSTYKAA